MTTAQST